MASKLTMSGSPVPMYSVTFGVLTDIPSPYKFHWKRNGALIGGAGSAPSYTTHPLRQQDFGNRYSVVVFGRDGISEETPEMGFFDKPALVAPVEPQEPEVLIAEPGSLIERFFGKQKEN